jgi:hypothetical protein
LSPIQVDIEDISKKIFRNYTYIYLSEFE